LSWGEGGAGNKRWNEPESQRDSNRIEITNVQAWTEQKKSYRSASIIVQIK